MSIESCPCDTCVYKTVAAKLSYLLMKRESEGGQAGGWVPTEEELEQVAAARLAEVVQLERSKRGS